MSFPNIHVARASLDDHTLNQFVEMAAESAEIKNHRDAKATPAVKSEAKKYAAELEKVLLEYLKKHPLTGEGYADKSPEDQLDELMTAEAEYLVLMTLRGEGVGTWDGDWDHFFADEKKEIKAMNDFLKSKLRKYSDGTGAGSLETAFLDAAFETTGADEDSEAAVAAKKGSMAFSQAKKEIISTLISTGRSDLANAVAAMKVREKVIAGKQFEKGDILTIKAHKSEPGKGMSYPAFVGTALDDGAAGGWDVYDVEPNDPKGHKDPSNVSVYGFSVMKVQGNPLRSSTQVTADLAWKEVKDAKGHRWVGTSKDSNYGFHIVEIEGPGIPLYRIGGLLEDGTPIKYKRQVKTVKEAQQIAKKVYDALKSDYAGLDLGGFGWSKA